MEPKLLTAERFVDTNTGFTYRYVHSDTEYFRPHYHDYYEIFLLLDGEATHLVNGESLRLERGALVFIRPSDTHDYVLRDGKKFSMLNITFTVQTLNALVEYLGEGFPSASLLSAALPPEVMLSESDVSYVLAQMSSMMTIDESDCYRRQTAMRVLIFRIFTRYFADYREQLDPEMPQWLTRLCEDMRKNRNFTYGIGKMVELSGRSREHLSRSIKKHMGFTLSEFINDLRLRSIADMLKNSNHDVADIVFESGFGNLSWASELFKKKYGVTMSEYRRS